jgi:EAL domain-containing protein (putative c-di-GMP-specific phosphodiesterase class I)
VQALGCTQMQGYLFSRPVRARDIRGLLAPIKGKVENAA